MHGFLDRHEGSDDSSHRRLFLGVSRRRGLRLRERGRIGAALWRRLRNDPLGFVLPPKGWRKGLVRFQAPIASVQAMAPGPQQRLDAYAPCRDNARQKPD